MRIKQPPKRLKFRRHTFQRAARCMRRSPGKNRAPESPEPRRELLEVVLDLLKLGERELAALFSRSISAKNSRLHSQTHHTPGRDRSGNGHELLLFRRAHFLDHEHQATAALTAHRLSELRQKSRVLISSRKHPCTIQHAGGAGAAQPTPQRDARARRGRGKLREQKKEQPLVDSGTLLVEWLLHHTISQLQCNTCYIAWPLTVGGRVVETVPIQQLPSGAFVQ